jgi:hypothetical protein
MHAQSVDLISEGECRDDGHGSGLMLIVESEEGETRAEDIASLITGFLDMFVRLMAFNFLVQERRCRRNDRALYCNASFYTRQQEEIRGH